MTVTSPRNNRNSTFRESGEESAKRASVEYQPLVTDPNADAPAQKVSWRVTAGLTCDGRRKWGWLGCGVVSVIVVAVCHHGLNPKVPSYTVEDVALVDFKVPALLGRSLVVADTSACPGSDPCGERSHRSCSHCPSEGDWIKDGCLCRLSSAGGLLNDLEEVANYVSHLDDSALITMKLKSNITLHNPNLIGADSENGTIQVFYKDSALGEGKVNPLYLPPWGTVRLAIDIDIKGVSAIVGMEMMQEMVRTGWNLHIDVHGSVLFFVGRLGIRASCICAMTSDVSDYVETRERVFSKRDCSYTYDDHW